MSRFPDRVHAPRGDESLRPAEVSRPGDRLLGDFVLMLALAVGVSIPGAASAQIMPGVQVDFDQGTISPLVNFGDPSTTSITSLFGGVVNVAVDPAGLGTVVGDTTVFYGDSTYSLDVLDWADGLGQWVSLTSLSAVVSPPNPPVLSGYSLRLDPDAGEVALVKTVSNVGTVVASAPVSLDPNATDYRLVLNRAGSLVTGRLIDLKDLDNSLADLSFDDVTGIPGFADGFPGFSLAEDSVSQLGADVTLDNFVAAPLAGSDTDADVWGDADDNCLVATNGPNQLSNQIDSDGDGYGNACDPDVSGDGFISTIDLSTILPLVGFAADGAALDSDFDGDRAVTIADLALWIRFFRAGQTTPGP